MSDVLSRARKAAFAQFVVEQMAGFAPVQAKAMFGGFGISHLGLTFALIVDEVLYFKVDEQSVDVFTARGLEPFRYESKGKVSSLKYHRAPPEVFDDADEMAHWARLGYDCAVRQQSKSARTPKQSGVAQSLSASKSAVPASTDPGDMLNLGPKSRGMMAQAGISGSDELRRLGSVMAFVKTKAIWPGASLNLLWALEGAISGRPWQQVAETDRASLLMALEDVQRQWREVKKEG